MKSVYCSFCGTKSPVSRKAVKNYGIVDLIDPHECTKEVQPYDGEQTPTPTFVKEADDRKFVKHLDGLSGLKKAMVSSNELRDRRFDMNEETPEQKSTAPAGALAALGTLNSKPSRDMFDFESEDEKDDSGE